MNSKYTNLIVSLVFALVTIGAFLWLWSMSKSFTINTAVADNLKPVEIETVKNEASTLLSGLHNIAPIPIPVPTSKMGTTNPFQ